MDRKNEAPMPRRWIKIEDLCEPSALDYPHSPYDQSPEAEEYYRELQRRFPRGDSARWGGRARS